MRLVEPCQGSLSIDAHCTFHSHCIYYRDGEGYGNENVETGLLVMG